LECQATLITQVDPTKSAPILPHDGEKVDILTTGTCVTFKNCS